MTLPAKAAWLLALALVPLAPVGTADPFVMSGEEGTCVDIGQGPGNGSAAPGVSPAASGYGATLHTGQMSLGVTVVPEKCLPILSDVLHVILAQAVTGDVLP